MLTSSSYGLSHITSHDRMVTSSIKYINIFYLQNAIQYREVCDNTTQIIRTTVCAVIFSPEKIICGTDEGLYTYEVIKEQVAKIDDVKKVFQIEMLPDEQLLVVLSSKIYVLQKMKTSQDIDIKVQVQFVSEL